MAIILQPVIIFFSIGFRILICFFFGIYFFPAVLEIQSYSSKLKRFLGFYSNHFLAYEVKGKRKGKFTGEVSITTKKETSIAFAFLNDRECKELDQTDLRSEERPCRERV